MATQIRISVTADDIRKAEKKNSMRCVVAQAVARTIPDACRIEVDTQSIRWTDGNGVRNVYLTPYAVQGYVIAFDAGDELEPFMFALDSRKRLPSPATKVSTDHGKKVHNATQQAKRTAKRAEQLAALAVASDADPVAAAAALLVPKAKAKAKRAASELVSVTEAYKAARAEGATRATTLPGETGLKTPAPPRVYKTSRREYGNRVLRINQPA
jgi:hypothetical protein